MIARERSSIVLAMILEASADQDFWDRLWNHFKTLLEPNRVPVLGNLKNIYSCGTNHAESLSCLEYDVLGHSSGSYSHFWIGLKQSGEQII